jgi:hypothetical protein
MVAAHGRAQVARWQKDGPTTCMGVAVLGRRVWDSHGRNEWRVQPDGRAPGDWGRTRQWLPCGLAWRGAVSVQAVWVGFGAWLFNTEVGRKSEKISRHLRKI